MHRFCRHFAEGRQVHRVIEPGQSEHDDGAANHNHDRFVNHGKSAVARFDVGEKAFSIEPHVAHAGVFEHVGDDGDRGDEGADGQEPLGILLHGVPSWHSKSLHAFKHLDVLNDGEDDACCTCKRE